jgi:hypothetical protein
VDQQSYEISERISGEISAIHNEHATQLLAKVGIDPEEYKKDPNIAREKGYVFVHETQGNVHRFVVAQVVAEDRYTINVKYDLETKDVADEPEEAKEEAETTDAPVAE